MSAPSITVWECNALHEHDSTCPHTVYVSSDALLSDDTVQRARYALAPQTTSTRVAKAVVRAAINAATGEGR